MRRPKAWRTPTSKPDVAERAEAVTRGKEMKRALIVVAAFGVMVLAGALAEGKKSRLGLLEWAAKATPEKMPVAVLIELGLKDEEVKSWPGRATVSGGRVVHREGFRF